MRRTIIAVVAAGAIVAAVGLQAASTAPAEETPTAQSFAQRLLRTPAVRYLSPSARSALGMFAHGDQRYADPDSLRGEEARQSGIVSGGEKAFGPGMSNVRVNDPAADDHQPDQTTQSETTIGVSGSNVAVGYNDSQQTLLFLTAATNLSGYSYSTDGGQSFHDGGTIPNFPGLANIGDPWITVDRSGTMYYGTLAIDVYHDALGVGVARSFNGGRTWTNAPLISPQDKGVYFGDKEALTSGPDPSKPSRDIVYAAWDDFFCSSSFKSCTTGLPVARTTDGGETWHVNYAGRLRADFEGCSFGQYFGANPIVDPSDGTLYVAAEKFEVNDPTCEGNAEFVISEVLFTSTDGGVTFSPEQLIEHIAPATRFDFLRLGHGKIMRLQEAPSTALLDGKLYVAWNDGRKGHSHIRMATTSDQGASWSYRWLTSGSNDEVMPALSGDDEGLHAAYYRRNANNTLDVYLQDSADGSSSSTRRVTNESSPGVFTVPQFDPIIAFGYMGDYIANVSDGEHRYLAWGDNRDVVTNFLWPDGRHDPNVYFARD